MISGLHSDLARRDLAHRDLAPANVHVTKVGHPDAVADLRRAVSTDHTTATAAFCVSSPSACRPIRMVVSVTTSAASMNPAPQ